MRILILSNSLVVIELFKLALKQESITAEFKENITEAELDSYDIIFVGESIIDLNKQLDIIENNIEYKELVAITNSNIKYTNKILKKPFLPEDIIAIIKDIEQEISRVKEPANVLDLEEIERIKSIIELNEYEDTIIQKTPIETLQAKESLKVKNKEAKRFLKELCKLSKQEQKELLKNAKVSIKIDFKD